MQAKQEICPLCQRVIVAAGTKCRDHIPLEQKRVFVKMDKPQED